MHTNHIARMSALVAALAFSAITPAAQAATASASISVTATVLSVCTIAAAPLPFGTYSSGVVDMTSQLTVVCTVTTPFNVGLSAGNGTGSTVTTRKMSNGANSLNYTLYSDSGRTVNWGNTVGTDTVVGTGTGLPQTLTVYGRIPAAQSVAPGSYTDVVLATITY